MHVYIPQLIVTTICLFLSLTMQSFSACAFSTQLTSRNFLMWRSSRDNVKLPDVAPVEIVNIKLYYLHSHSYHSQGLVACRLV